MNMLCRTCGNVSPWHSSHQCGGCRRTRPSTYRYDATWRRKRAAYLRGHPACVFEVNGVVCGKRATDVDHVTPLSRGGDDAPSNYQALCHAHHSSKTVNEFVNAQRCVASGRTRTGGSRRQQS